MDPRVKRECIRQFGERGIDLVKAMEKVHQKDFYVEPGNHPHEIRVAASTGNRMIIFEFNEDYSKLIFPDGTRRTIEEIEYKDIIRYLPRLRL